MYTLRDRCAGEEIIIEVNRPPRNEVSVESARGRNDDVMKESPRASPRLEAPSGGHADDVTGRRRPSRDEDIVYVELDVDCASARRQNATNTSKYAVIREVIN